MLRFVLSVTRLALDAVRFVLDAVGFVLYIMSFVRDAFFIMIVAAMRFIVCSTAFCPPHKD